MLQSNSFKIYSYSIAYLALSIMIGYISLKNISSTSYLFECFISIIAFIVLIKSIINMNSIKKNLGAFLMLALNGVIFLSFTIWQNPNLESMGNLVFIFLILVLIVDFITYQVSLYFKIIE